MDELTVELVLPSSVDAGGLVVGEVVVRNGGTEPVVVSSWLGLAEGDLWLHVKDPAGASHPVYGRYQLDVLPREVTLGGGQAIARGVQLTATSEPRPFVQPGTYRLRAVYAPGATSPTVESDEVAVVVEPASTAAQRAVADLLAPEAVHDALAFGHVDASSEAAGNLETIAREHPERLEAVAARIVLAASAARDGSDVRWDVAFAETGLAVLARVATALLPPAAAAADPLTVAAVGHVAAQAAGPAQRRAIAMLQGEPFAG
jgi:hypothetical protein